MQSSIIIGMLYQNVLKHIFKYIVIYYIIKTMAVAFRGPKWFWISRTAPIVRRISSVAVRATLGLPGGPGQDARHDRPGSPSSVPSAHAGACRRTVVIYSIVIASVRWCEDRGTKGVNAGPRRSEHHRKRVLPGRGGPLRPYYRGRVPKYRYIPVQTFYGGPLG